MASSGQSGVDGLTTGFKKLSVDKKVPGILSDIGTIVFLGEGNFTFCTAFAVYRQGWSNIVPTEIVLDSQSWKETLDLCQSIAQRQFHEILNSLRQNPPIKQELNATNMGTREGLQQRLKLGKMGKLTFWFQCPWYKGYGQVSDIVRGFVQSAARIQQDGEYLLIGVCTIPTYYQQYRLPETATRSYYQLAGTDDTFVKEMLIRGYQWTSSIPNSPMRLEKWTDFRVFIFKRNRTAFNG